MQIDWNWFFAAFAQCGAALIGIISAFIISKLLGENDKYEQLSNTLNGLLIKRQYYLDKISVYRFNWHDHQNIRYDYDLGKAIENGEFEGLSDEEKLEKLFSIDQSLFRTENCLKYLEERIISSSPLYAPVGPNLSIKMPNIANLPPAGIWDKVSEEKDKIINIKIECESLIKEFQVTLNALIKTKLNLKPIKFTILLLSIGFFVSVIYPLHFMPLEINSIPQVGWSIEIIISNIVSLRGFLLLCMFLIIESIFIFFLFLIHSLEKKYMLSIDSIDKSWLDIREYSPYFECLVSEEKR
ncbi:MAG: hypothetical protein EOM44_12570 [Bacteroidia bacterium]|nr:hypothetical protein [Bacteroidia bacterium]